MRGKDMTDKQQAQKHITAALREYLSSLDHRMKQESDPAIACIIKDRMVDLDYWYGVWVGDENQHIMPRNEWQKGI